MTTLAAQAPRGANWLRGYDFVRWLVGAVLLTAAGMKGYELATGPVAEKGLLTSRWFLIATVELELALGLCLMSGVWKRQIWWAAVVSFAAFACITAYKAWQGEASCGCFGRAEVDPRYTLALDIILLMSLIACHPKPELSQSARRAAIVTVLILAVGLPAGAAMASAHPASMRDDGDILRGGSFVVLEPEKWIGKQFPLLPHIDIGDRFKEGKWIVVLYDHNCSHCQGAMPKYQQIAETLAGKSNSPRLALVELPPFAERERPVVAARSWDVGRLSTTYQWFVQTPVEIALVDGLVVLAKQPGEGLTWLNDTEFGTE